LHGQEEVQDREKVQGREDVQGQSQPQKAGEKEKGAQVQRRPQEKSARQKSASKEIPRPKIGRQESPQEIRPPTDGKKGPRRQSQAGPKETHRTSGPNADLGTRTRTRTRPGARACRTTHEPDPTRPAGTILATTFTTIAASRK
jgi:hypothetical protein